MPSFLYSARDRAGVLQSGSMDAVDDEEVLSVLQGRGLTVTSLTRKAAMGSGQSKMVRRLRRGIKGEDKVLFCQQLAVLLDAGIPLLKSLEVICSQVESRPLLVILEQVRKDIEGGKTFRDALAKHSRVFSGFWINLVETGEASGHLSQSLNQLAEYLETAQTIQQKAMTAMTYPAVLISASVIAILIFMLKIIPTFKNIFISMKIELPPLTKAILQVSDFMRHYVLLVAAVIAVAIWLFRRAARTEQGRWIIDDLALRIPVFGQMVSQLQLAQFARGLATLLDSGVPILFSLEIMQNSASNKIYGRAIGQVKDMVREGKTMAEPMFQAGIFPPMMVQMIQVGEEIGELGKMLQRVADYYEERLSTFIDRMSVLFEPIAIAFMAIVIGTLVMAMFMPIFKMAGGGGE